MLCSICFNEIQAVGDWTSGNNAQPVNFGRCCNKCDNEVVIPARITMMTNRIPNEVQMDMIREQLPLMQKAIEIYDEFKAKTAEKAEVEADMQALEKLLDRMGGAR